MVGKQTTLCLALLTCVIGYGSGPSSAAGATAANPEILAVESLWSEAILRNDVRRMSALLAEDWVLFDSDGGALSRDRFLGVIASGDLVHDGMKLDSPAIRIYGNTAVVSGIASSSGKYRGQPFSLRERSTDVFIKRHGRWQCVLTQLTRVSG
jgi:ketosteroid isomerase-like protein